MKVLKYYAYALHNGKIEQLLVTRTIYGYKNGNPQATSKQEWTGKIYKTLKEAGKDIELLNCSGNLKYVEVKNNKGK